MKFWKKNRRIYTLANECDGDCFDGWFPAFARMTAGVSKSPGLPGDCLGSYKKTTLSIAPVSPGWGIKIRSYLWVRLKVWFFARQLFSNTHPPMTQHVRPFYGSGLRLWKKNILAPLCHPRECGDPTLQGSNLKFWKKNSRIYTLAN